MKLSSAMASIIALAILAPTASFAGDPIPGVDVNLGKNKGGEMSNAPAKPVANDAIINTTRSNIKHPSDKAISSDSTGGGGMGKATVRD